MAGELNLSRKELRKVIGNAEKNAWDELLEGLNRDPWGRPYKTVMNKMRSDNINICEKLPEEIMEEMLCNIIPQGQGGKQIQGWGI